MHQLSAAFTAGSLNNKTGQEAHFVDEDKSDVRPYKQIELKNFIFPHSHRIK